MASAPIQLIDMEEAKRHVYEELDVNTKDDDIDLKISMASEIVMNHAKLSDIPSDWIVAHSPLNFEVPYIFKAATLLVFGELYMNREASTANVLSPAILDLLRSKRRPTLA